MKATITTQHLQTGVADEVLREVWQIKDTLSASYSHDLNRLFAEARERQRKSGRASVNLTSQQRGPATRQCQRSDRIANRKLIAVVSHGYKADG